MDQSGSTFQLVSVTITYLRDGKPYKRVVDIGRSSGIVWDPDSVQAAFVKRVPEAFPADPPQEVPPLSVTSAQPLQELCWWDPLEQQWKCTPGPE